MAMERLARTARKAGAVTPMAVGPVDCRALLALPGWAAEVLAGLEWRSCRFRPGRAEGLRAVTAQGVVTLALPGDMAAAVDRRRSEYLAGRLCAALALRALGALEVVARDGRAPVWPAGISGSISHAGDRAMAVALRGGQGIGLDCEPPMTPGIRAEIGPMILAPGDAARRPPDMTPEAFATLAFSAKEAAYKALSPALPDIPDFREAAITAIDPAEVTLLFRGGRIRVLHGTDQGECITLAIAPRANRPGT